MDLWACRRLRYRSIDTNWTSVLSVTQFGIYCESLSLSLSSRVVCARKSDDILMYCNKAHEEKPLAREPIGPFSFKTPSNWSWTRRRNTALCMFPLSPLERALEHADYRHFLSLVRPSSFASRSYSVSFSRLSSPSPFSIFISQICI